MASSLVLRRRMAASVTALSTGIALIPTASVNAEAPSDVADFAQRKPIYDDLPALSSPSTVSPFERAQSSQPAKSTSPSPTDRLASHIAHGRVSLYRYAANLEDRLNALVSKAFNLEHSFTSTMASLAPGRDTNERLMPGAIYVLVAAMGSSILVRNRNILLRWTAPLAVGLGAGWAIIPVTMQNVSDLAWRYEKRFPALADTHVRIQNSVTHFMETGVAHSKMSAAIIEDKIREGRERVEEWVSRGT